MKFGLDKAPFVIVYSDRGIGTNRNTWMENLSFSGSNRAGLMIEKFRFGLKFAGVSLFG